MKEGDVSGLALLQKKYGLVGVKMENGKKAIVMVNGEEPKPKEVSRVPLDQTIVYFKAECNFKDKVDIAEFFYSLDGKSWTLIGSQLHMAYTLPHFMGYRFGLFNYATKNIGGFADFDFFRIEDRISRK
jgi:beta-xylosidase